MVKGVQRAARLRGTRAAVASCLLVVALLAAVAIGTERDTDVQLAAVSVAEVRFQDPPNDPMGGLDIELEPHADVREVVLSSDGRSLEILWAMAGRIPSVAPRRDLPLTWHLSMQPVEGRERYTVMVQLVAEGHPWGEGWITRVVLDGPEGSRTRPGPSPKVEGRTVRVRVPLSDLPGLMEPFQWWGGAGVGGMQDSFPNEEVLGENSYRLYVILFPSGDVIPRGAF